jgi:hypothetical protein
MMAGLGLRPRRRPPLRRRHISRCAPSQKESDAEYYGEAREPQ